MKIISTFFMGAGVLLMAAAFALMLYVQWDEKRAGAGTLEVLSELTPVLEEAREESMGQGLDGMPVYKIISDMEMPTVEIEGRMYIGELEIPSLGLDLPVMNDWSYPDLKISPCRYRGSAYRDDFIIAAHNYICHFGTLNQLLAGDEIYFTDVDGNRFAYQVIEMEVLKPTAIEQMFSGNWDLTLFTCTFGGRTRLAVRCAGVDSAAGSSLN